MRNIKGTLNATKAVVSPEFRTAASGTVKLLNPSGTNAISLAASASLATDLNLTFPATNGSNGQVLSNNGSGTLSWVSVSSYADSLTLIDNGSTIGVNQAGTFTWTAGHDWNPSTSQVNSLRLLKASLTGTGRRDSDRILFQAKSYDGTSHTIEARAYIALNSNDGAGSYFTIDGRLDGGFNTLFKVGISDGFISTNGANFGMASVLTGRINLYSAGGNNSTSLQAGNASSSLVYILPTTSPLAGQFLTASAPSSNLVTLSWATGSGYGAGLGLRLDLGAGTTMEIDPTYSNTFSAAQTINRGTTGSQDGLILDINPPTTGGQIRESSTLRFRSRMRDAGASLDRSVDFRFKAGATSQDGQGGYLKIQQRIDNGTYIDVFEIQQGALIATGSLTSLSQLPSIQTGYLLGNASGSSGAPQQISVGSGLNLSGGVLSLTSGVVGGTIALNQIPIGSGTGTVSGSSNFTWVSGTITSTSSLNSSTGMLCQNLTANTQAEVGYQLNTASATGVLTLTSSGFSTNNLKKANQLYLLGSNNVIEYVNELVNDTAKFIWGINTSEVGRLSKSGLVVTSNGSASLAVGSTGTINPVLKVDSSTASADGVSIVGGSSGSGVTILALSAATDSPINITPKGASDINLNGEVSSVSYRAKSKDLTVTVGNNDIFEVACPVGASIGGTIHYTVQATDNVDTFAGSGVIKYAAVNKAGTIYTGVGLVGSEITAKSNGSVNVTSTWSVVSGSNKITLRLNIAQSGWILVDTKVKFVLDNESTRKVTLL